MNSLFNEIIGTKTNSVVSALKGINNPEAMFNQMMNTNPQFRNFVEANRGKSAEQIARENGIDPSILNMIKR